MRGAKLVIALIVLAILVSALGFLKVGQRERRNRYFDTDRITFVPRPETIKYMTLGYDNVMADILWIRAIQYYGSHFSRMKDHPEDWYRVAEALQTLRPHFIKGTEFVATAMAEGIHEPAKARTFLTKALEESPGVYEYPYNSAMFAAMIEKNKRLAADNMCEAAVTYRTVNTDLIVSSTEPKALSNPFGNLPYPHLDLEPQRAVLPPGEKLNLVLSISRTPRAATTAWEVHYDPERLQVDSVTPESLDATIDAASGIIRVAHVYDPGVANVPLATLHARTVKPGTGTIKIIPKVFVNKAGEELDLFPPRFYSRFCNAYRSNIGGWQIALTEWYRQLAQANNEVEKNLLETHINRTLNTIDTNVLNHLLVLWLQKYGTPPESPTSSSGEDKSVETMLGDAQLRQELLDLGMKVRSVMNSIYMQEHPDADPNSRDFSIEVWSDNKAAATALDTVSGLWEALVPFFRHDHGRDPHKTEIDEMADQLRDLYDIPAILHFRFVLKYQRAPQPGTDDMSLKAFEAIKDPREGQQYWVIQKEGHFVVESTGEMAASRENPLTDFNGFLQAYKKNPKNQPLPKTLQELYERDPRIAERFRDPYGREFIFDPDTFTVSLPGPDNGN